MGGKGSGRYWHYGAKETVNNCRSIDVHRWQRDGLLESDCWFDWQWKRNGKAVANINVQVKTGYLLLLYRYRRYGGDWESIEEPVKLVKTACNYGGHRYWFYALLWAAVDVWQFFMEQVVISPVGIVIAWFIQASVKMMLIGQCVERIRFGNGWTGSLVF